MNSPHSDIFMFSPLDENNRKWLGMWDMHTGGIVIVTWHYLKGFIRSYIGNDISPMIFTEMDCCEAWMGPNSNWDKIGTEGIPGLRFE